MMEDGFTNTNDLISILKNPGAMTIYNYNEQNERHRQKITFNILTERFNNYPLKRAFIELLLRNSIMDCQDSTKKPNQQWKGSSPGGALENGEFVRILTHDS